MMSIMLAALVVGNYRLENKLVDAKEQVYVLEKDKAKLDIRIDVLENANKVAIEEASKEAKIVEKKVVEIKKVYVPQIEYIDRYVGDGNESNCEDIDGLLKSVVY